MRLCFYSSMKTETRNLEILTLALNGSSGDSIAEQFAISRSRVRQIVSKACLKHYPDTFRKAIEKTREKRVRCLHPDIYILRSFKDEIVLPD